MQAEHWARGASGFDIFQTAIGSCGIAWSGEGEGLVGVFLPEESGSATLVRMQKRFPDVPQGQPPGFVQLAMARVVALLDGTRDDLTDIPLNMSGVPPFHRRVYEVARAIPPGRTLTYGEVAAKLGEPGASRAVGQALGQNPFAPVVPCHRVLAADGRSGGFSGGTGVPTKLKMLEIEGARFGAEPDLFERP